VPQYEALRFTPVFAQPLIKTKNRDGGTERGLQSVYVWPLSRVTYPGLVWNRTPRTGPGANAHLALDQGSPDRTIPFSSDTIRIPTGDSDTRR